jgi:hypothetical protein
MANQQVIDVKSNDQQNQQQVFNAPAGANTTSALKVKQNRIPFGEKGKDTISTL